MPLDTAATITIDATDANGNLTPNAKETVTGVVNVGTSSLVNCLRGQDNTTAQAHSTGANVVQWFTANDWNDLISLILTGFNQAGALTTASLSTIYPVGCIYAETTGTNPGTTFGFGTWAAFGAGRVLVGAGTSDQTFTAGATGGESNHTLTVTELASHNHNVSDPGHYHQENIATTGGPGTGITGTANIIGNSGSTQDTSVKGTGITINNTGGGGAHNNLQPYIVVYMWHRTA